MKKILVVDDDPLILEALVMSLTEESFDVVGVGDTDAAEEWIQREFFAVVLSDLRMRTDRDGLNLLEAVSRISPRSKFAAMTGFSTAELERELSARGAALVLQKPFDIAELSRALGAMLGTLEAHAAEPEQDLEQLYTDTLPLLRGIAIRRFGLDRDDAAELVQESWCLFLERRVEVMQPRAWLAGTVANLCKQQIGRRVRARLHDDIAEARDLAYETAADTIVAVGQALDRVDDRTRALCNLIAVEQRSYNEVSQTLGIPLGSVGPLYIRAKKKMKAVLSAN
jgi:RNA polymerase sigma factor (sigma-70 family)